MIIVVTGGIGSGKSSVCSLIREMYGFPVYDADSRVKNMYRTCPGLLARVESAVGAVLRNSDGNFQPSLLADIVFGDRKMLEAVEEVVFPALEEDFRRWMRDVGAETVVFESATVLEKPYFSGFGDVVVIVDAPVDVRMKRAADRDGVSCSEIMARMRNQPLMNRISQGEETPEGYLVCPNVGTFDELSLAVREILGKIGIKQKC